MRKLILLCGFLSIISCNKKIQNREFFIEEFGWEITIPDEFEYMSKKEIQDSRNLGIDAIEDELGEDIIDQVTVLFWIKNGQYNSLEANYQPYDERIDGNYDETNDDINEVSIMTLKSKIPSVQIDTLSSNTVIDNIKFSKFYMKLTYPNGLVLHSHSYSHLFDKRDFTVSISYVNEEIGNQMLKSFRESTFKTD